MYVCYIFIYIVFPFIIYILYIIIYLTKCIGELGPCSGTNDHPRRDTDMRIWEIKSAFNFLSIQMVKTMFYMAKTMVYKGKNILNLVFSRNIISLELRTWEFDRTNLLSILYRLNWSKPCFYRSNKK